MCIRDSFIAVIVILLLYNIKLKIKLVYSFLFCIIYIATISPWLLRNYSKYGEAKLSSISGYNLLAYNVSFTEVYKTGKSIEEIRKDFIELAVKQGIDTTNKFSFKNSEIFSNVAKQYI